MKTILPFLALLSTISLAPSWAKWDNGLQGIDHMYSDITNFNVSNDSVQQAETDCFNACNATANCYGWVVTPATPNCGTQALCYLKSAMLASNPNDCRISGYVPRSIVPQAFQTMPVGSIVPSGWLADQLHVQATGLTGYLPHFWADIMNSSWIGGTADGGLHERAPYWMNGLVPLSFLTNDTNLVALRNQYINYIIDNQEPSGWIGLDDMPTNGDQYWSRFNVILSLIQYYEGSGDARAITCIFNYLGEAKRRMQMVPVQDWAAARGQDFIMGLFWLVDNFDTLPGVPTNYSQAFLIDLANLTHTQMIANGADWKTWYDTNLFPETAACDGKGTPCEMRTHGVNIGQALKSEAVWYRLSQDLTDIASTYIRIQKLDTFHNGAAGMFQADEHLAGAIPSHGTETCAVVEAIVSYAQSGAIIGDPYLFERAEKVMYNAMPGSTTKDMWTRVYLQQSNEIFAVTENPHVFYTDGGDAALFSLEGNYGCCTANMHAGYPKGVYRSIGYTTTGTVAVFMWMPLTATTPYATLTVTTDYPFGDVATVVVTPSASATGPVPVMLRIPSWAAGATISINGGSNQPLTGSNGTFFPTSTVGTAATTFVINFNPQVRLETFYNGAVAIYRGALLYSVWIGQNISVTHTYAYNSQDLSITATGTVPWNIALVINDRSNPGADFTFNSISPPSPVPFNSTAIPNTLSGYGRVVNNWGIVENAADAPPSSPACGTAGACGDQIPITLVPFGSTHIRMSILPTA